MCLQFPILLEQYDIAPSHEADTIGFPIKITYASEGLQLGAIVTL